MPGSPPQVIVSTDLVASLPAEQFEMVLRHEASHLAHRHDRYLGVAAMVRSAFGYVPMAPAASSLLSTALERWADEDAAGGSEGRTVVRDALLAVTATLVAEGIAAFAGAATILERLVALEDPAPARGFRSTLLVAAPAVLLATLAVVAVAAGHHEIRLLLAAAGICGA